MRRYIIAGIAVVIISGIAITMALVNNTALADNAPNEAGVVQAVIGEADGVDTAVTQDPIDPFAGQNFVDEDGDGVCDTCGNVPGSSAGNQYGQANGGSAFVDEDGDGVCDNFIDEDGDGLCDLGGGTGTGTGSGYGSGTFVDEDGDGVCDTCGTAPADGTGNQYRRQGGRGGNGQGGGRRGNNTAVQP